MSLKRYCCCDQPKQIVRFIECELVTSIPSGSYMIPEQDCSFFLDLGSDLEVPLGNFEIYSGGRASTNEAPVKIFDDFVFVPRDSIGLIAPDNNSVSPNNLGSIFGFRHRGFRIKEKPLMLTTAQLFSGDFVSGYRFRCRKPSNSDDDKIDQVDSGGFYFLGNTFSQTPALIQERTSEDQDGNPVNFFVGYNPRREIKRPEQARYYGNGPYPKLIFDFTSQFPSTVTLTFTYKFRTGLSGSRVQREEVITRTYSKFVAGGKTKPTTESITRNDGIFTYRNVDGFDSESPEDSSYILFGYRSTDCSEERPDQQGGGRPDYIVSAPSIPIRFYSFGNDDDQIGGGFGVERISTGDGATGLSPVLTDENFSASNTATFFPHELRCGAVMTDVTTGPNLAPIGNDEDIPFVFGTSCGFTNPTGANPSPNVTNSACSYKSGSALTNIHSFSIECSMIGLQRPAVRRGKGVSGVNNITIRNLVEKGFAFGTIDVRAITLDATNGSLSLQSMTNPLTGAYHFLTDGMPGESNFRGISFVGGSEEVMPPPEVSGI
jgi:hypothetical protein